MECNSISNKPFLDIDLEDQRVSYSIWDALPAHVFMYGGVLVKGPEGMLPPPLLSPRAVVFLPRTAGQRRTGCAPRQRSGPGRSQRHAMGLRGRRHAGPVLWHRGSALKGVEEWQRQRVCAEPTGSLALALGRLRWLMASDSSKKPLYSLDRALQRCFQRTLHWQMDSH
jgi:hypothetical protein